MRLSQFSEADTQPGGKVSSKSIPPPVQIKYFVLFFYHQNDQRESLKWQKIEIGKNEWSPMIIINSTLTFSIFLKKILYFNQKITPAMGENCQKSNKKNPGKSDNHQWSSMMIIANKYFCLNPVTWTEKPPPQWSKIRLKINIKKKSKKLKKKTCTNLTKIEKN